MSVKITDLTSYTAPQIADVIPIVDVASGVTKKMTAKNFIKAFLPIGMISPFGGGSAPTGWLMCDGSAVSRTTYADLFAVLSTTYGTGDGSTTFNLPDLRTRVPVGRYASESEFTPLGKYAGNKTHTLTESEMPSHYHTWTASRQLAGTDDNNNTSEFSRGDRATSDPVSKNTDSKGGNSPHNNLQPYVIVNYIVKT